MQHSTTPRAEPPPLPPQLDRHAASPNPAANGVDGSEWRRTVNHGDTWIAALLIAAIVCFLFFLALFIASTASTAGSGSQSNSGSKQGTQEGVLDADGEPGNTLEPSDSADAKRAAGTNPGAAGSQEDATEHDATGNDQDMQAEPKADNASESEIEVESDASSGSQAMLSRVPNRQPIPRPQRNAQGAPSPSGGAAGSDLVTTGGVNPFLGDGKPANSTVFVIDVSGSMQMPDRLPRVVKALSRAIDQLKPKQEFCVLLFDDFYYFNPKVELIAATKQNQELIQRWLNQPPGGGGTNPMPAMEAAIQLQPERIVLLSDGEFDPSSAITITQLNQANQKPARIDCVGLMEQVLVLQEIANRNQGVYYQAW